MDDHALLLEFVRNRSEHAFRGLVDRHLGMVYSTACRMVHDPHLAEDVAQSVFLTFARQAAAIGNHQVIAGWLHRTTRHQAMHAVRSEQRRRQREQTAVAMQLNEPEPLPEWILEHLESAMEDLEPDDRDVIVLRYLEGRSLREVGEELSVSEDAARMRVNRALERLRGAFAAKDAVVTTTLLATALSTGSSAAVPVGLAATVTSSAIAGTAWLAASGVAGATWIGFKTAAVVAGTIALVGVSAHLLRQRNGVRSPLPTASQTAVPASRAENAQGNSLLDGSAAAQGDAIGGSVPDAGVSPATPFDTTVATRLASLPPDSQPGARPPGEAQALVSQAIELLNHQRYEDALPLLDRATQLNPRFAVAFLFRGNVFDGLQQLDAALTNYTRTIELRPDMAQGWFNRSRIHEQKRQYDSVIHDCGEALKLEPKFWQAYLGRGRAYFFQNQPAEALKDFDRVAELNPEWVETYDLRAQIHWQAGDQDQALANRRQAVEIEPQTARLHYLLGDTLRQMQRHSESIVHLTRAIELDPADADAWRSRGDAHAGLQDSDAAIADYTDYLRMVPQNTAYVNRRGVAYSRIGMLAKAREDFDRAIRMSPNRGEFYENRGKVLRQLGMRDEAKADFDKAAALRSSRTSTNGASR